jgi:hypothetical protein
MSTSVIIKLPSGQWNRILTVDAKHGGPRYFITPWNYQSFAENDFFGSASRPSHKFRKQQLDLGSRVQAKVSADCKLAYQILTRKLFFTREEFSNLC